MVTRTEGGLRRHRLEFAREDNQGEFPEDPEWELYSDTVREFEWSPETNIEAARGIGDVDPSEFYKGFEEHEVELTYDMQKWFVDEEGNAYDASYDGFGRDIDNQLDSSHTIVDRESKTNINPESTVAHNVEDGGEAIARDSRIYTVVAGALIDEATIEGDPGSQNPVATELSYQAEKGRTYQIDQPTEPTELAVYSTSAEDDHQTLTIEDEGAETVEEIELTGETEVTTAETEFEDIDVLYLDEETEGNVYVAEASDGGDDSVLSVLYGAEEYEGTEGDRGIPRLGEGTREEEVGESYEIIIGDTIEKPRNTSFAMDINSVEVSVSNDIDVEERVESVRARLDVGERETELDATIVGESESQQKIMDHLSVKESNVLWHMDGGELRVDDAVLMDPGSRTIEAGEAAMTLDNTFEGRGLTIDPEE